MDSTYHGASGEGSNVLERGGLGGGGGNDDGVLHGVVLLEGLDELGNGGSLLTNGDVDAVKLLGLVVSIVPSLLVQHSIESNGGLSSLTITNNQFTLSTSNRNHGVHTFDTSLHRFVDRLTWNNSRGFCLGTHSLCVGNRSLWTLFNVFCSVLWYS